MCERLPGDRCSHHVKQEVDKKTLKAASIFVASGAASPQELTGADKVAYDSAVADLRAAQEELRHTPTEIKKRAAEALKARKAGNIAYAVELETSVTASESLRARRKAGLKQLVQAEAEADQSMSSAAYKREEKRQAKTEVRSKIDTATEGLSGEDKNEAILKTARNGTAAGRREIARLKKARTKLDKDLSVAVDAGNAAAAEEVLDKIKKNTQKISYAQARSKMYDDEAQAVAKQRIRTNPSLSRPSSHASIGCGGGCGYVSPAPSPAPATPSTSTRRSSARRTPKAAAPSAPAYVPTRHSVGCGGRSGC